MGIALFLFDALYLHNYSAIGLNWNLFLAWIPIGIVKCIGLSNAKSFMHRVKVLFLSFIWLLFFPNAPYIITDFIHLFPQHSNAYWHRQMMFYTYAFVSLFCGLLSLYWIQQVWQQAFSKVWSTIFAVVSIVLSAYGVYLGRVPRFNSWDFFLKPIALCKFILHSFNNTTAILMTCEFAVFIGLTYIIMLSLIHLREPPTT